MGHHEDLLKDPEFREAFADMLNSDGSMTIHRSRAYPPWSDVCGRCARLRDAGARLCAAFGDQTIPDDIWLGRHTHRTAHPGDGGLLFEPVTDQPTLNATPA